jgi:hypothetical protein
MNKPSIFLLGVQKCGTTAIAKMLGDHSEIFVPSVKETYFFVDESYFPKGESWYLEEFYSNTATGNARLLCDATPFYLCSEEALKRIASFADESARFVVCLRNPVNRAYSAYWHQRRLGNENASFEDALRLESGRISDAKAKGGRWWRHAYTQVGLYAEHLERAFSILGRERFLVLNENDLAGAEALKPKLHAFLGLKDAFEIDQVSKANKSVMPRSRLLQRFVVGKNPLKRLIRTFVPREIRSTIGQKILRSNLKQFSYPPMENSTRQLLNKIFADDLVELKKLGINVPSGWTEKKS